AGVDGAFAAAAGHVAGAVLVGAEKGAAALHALGHAGLLGVEAVRRAVGVAAGASGIVVRAVPVGAPLPDVAGHVVEAEAVGREARHRRGAREAVFLRVAIREAALEGVGHGLPVGAKGLAPDIRLLRQSP